MAPPGKRVLVVGGSPDYAGAVYLCGISALRSGAGSVHIMAPEKVAWTLNQMSADLVTKKLPGKYLARRHLSLIRKKLETADVLVIGNGMGVRPATAFLVRSLISWKGPKVIDADALKVLRGSKISNAILTPNGGEWELLKRNNDIKSLLKQDVVIIKKGARTEIISKNRTFKQPSTNRGLEKAGTGDVLAGLCAGALARGYSLWRAANEAARIGNSIADLLTRKKKGYFFLASDIAEELRKRV